MNNANIVQINVNRQYYDLIKAINDSIANNYNVKYFILKGGSRSGKTMSTIDVIDTVSKSIPNININIYRKTKTSAVGSIDTDFTKLMNGREWHNVHYSYNKTLSSRTYPNNSKIEFKTVVGEDELRGTGQYIAWLNEPYTVTEGEFLQISQRSSIVIVDYNPSVDFFIKKYIKLPNALLFESTFKDNAFLDAGVRGTILSYQPINMCELYTIDKSFCDENKKNNEDLIIKNIKECIIDKIDTKRANDILNEYLRCVDNEKYGTANDRRWKVEGLGIEAENDNKIYNNWMKCTNKEFDELDSTSYFGLDFGFTNPNAIVEVKYAGNKVFYLRERMYVPLKSISPTTLGDYMVSTGIPQGNVTYIFSDSQDKDLATGISYVNDLRSIYNLNVVKTNKSTYKARFEFINSCIIYVCEDSSNIWNEYYGYEYETIKGRNAVFQTEKPIKVNDHIMNAIEYAIMDLKAILSI